MANSLRIRFNDNPNAVFLAGQTLEGTIELRLNGTVKARGLRLVFKGKAECSWSETKGAGRNRSATTYSGSEIYLNSKSYVLGSENGPSFELPAGVHNYNFQCLLPESLPYSVEGSSGFVRYKVETTLDIPWGFNYEMKKAFIVVRHDDLNLVTNPNYRRPYKVKELQTFGCLFWKSSPLVMTMRVPKTGFGLGKRIPIRMELVNKSSSNIYSTDLKLEKTEMFNSTSPLKIKTSKSIVTSKHRNRRLRPGETDEFEEFLEIPQILQTSNDRFCKVFQIRYGIKFKAKTDGFSKSPKMFIPITIGNVGITELQPTTIETTSQVQPVVSTIPTALPMLLPISLLDLPPSFEEALRDRVPTYEESQFIGNSLRASQQ